MADELLKLNLYFDESNKLKILDPTVSNQTNDLIESCKDYEEKMQEFEQLVESIIATMQQIGEAVDKKKMAAIGATNLLKSMAKDRESEVGKLQAAVSEKVIELEHLDAEYDSLQLLEVAQQETIDYLTQLR